jgi:hypothetical protein
LLGSDPRSNPGATTKGTHVKKRILLAVLLPMMAVSGLLFATANPASASNTGPFPNCGYQSPGFSVTVRVCDQSGGRTINYSWFNNTGAQRCVAAYWWNQGARNQIDPAPGTAYVVPAGATLNFHDTHPPYTVFADATIEVNTCNTSNFTFRLKIGALNNPNVFI